MIVSSTTQPHESISLTERGDGRDWEVKLEPEVVSLRPDSISGEDH